jgi:hypothetical protein
MRQYDVTAAPDLRDWLMSLAAFARCAADRPRGRGFPYFLNDVAPHLRSITRQLDGLDDRRVIVLGLVHAG